MQTKVNVNVQVMLVGYYVGGQSYDIWNNCDLGHEE
jgi:hypothetical protein